MPDPDRTKEPTLQGSNINLVKQHNVRVVLLSLLREPSLSRVQLARQTQLSNTTITNIINELLEQNILAEEDNDPPIAGELRPVGRPRTRLRLLPDARFVLGIHIGVGIFRVALANLCDEICCDRTGSFDRDAPSDAVLEQMAATAQALIAQSGVPRERIIGVGVGASGLVEASSGINLMAPNLNWHNVPLRSYFEQTLKLPVRVDNNVRSMAVAETYFGAGQGVDSLAFVYGGMGVGAGLVARGQAFRGSISGAGEIGHTIMVPHGGEPCRCGNNGCLETLVSEPAIMRWAEKIAISHPDGLLATSLQQRQDLTPIERVFAAGREGDEQVRAMLAERAYYLGVAVAGLINLFNPEMILFGGIFAQGQDLFLEPAIGVARAKAFAGLGEKVRMQATSFGWKAGVSGAAALALMQFFYGTEVCRMDTQ